jgi:hypothetical protein
VLKNSSSSCLGSNGCVFDEAHVVPLTSQRIQLDFKSRSEPVTARITASKFKLNKTSAPVTLQQGDVKYGQPFSATIRTGTPDVLSIRSQEGNQDFTAQTLKAGSFPSWLVSVGDPQLLNPDTTIFTMKVVDASCH